MELAPGLNVALAGPADAPGVVFLHGFGCGQAMWRHVAPAFETDHRVVLMDLPGAPNTDPALYDRERHVSLQAYADDVLRVVSDLGLDDVTIVGHSVSSMIGVLAHLASPETVTRLVLVSPSARYIDEDGYRGGFSRSDIEDLIETMDRNHLGWQDPLAGLVAGEGHDDARAEVEDSFCCTRPEVAAQFAAVTFFADNRSDLIRVAAPTLVIQVRDDAIAPMSAGEYVHEHIAGSQLRVIESRGHAPHVTDPDDVIAVISEFLRVPVRAPVRA